MSDFAEPLPPDPRSIQVWPTFLAGCRAWLRLFVPVTVLFLAVILPVAILAAWATPTLSGAMFGHVEETFDIPAREWFGFAGVIVLAILGGGLATIAAAIVADHALAGEPVPGPGATAERVLDRVLPVVGAWIVYMVTLWVPLLLLFGIVFAIAAVAGGLSPDTASRGDYEASFAIGALAGVLVGMVPTMAIAQYGRFSPLRAMVRGSGPIASWRDSFALVRGRWWRTFGFVLLVAVAVQAVVSGAMVFAIFGFALHPVVGLAVYGAAIAACAPFQVFLEMALMRRLESRPHAGAVPTTIWEAQPKE